MEVLIWCGLWAGERLDLDKAVPLYRRARRSISVLDVPCEVGACHCRLRHVGEKGVVMASPPGLVNLLRVFF